MHPKLLTADSDAIRCWWHFDCRDIRTVTTYPHDGLEFARWEVGDRHRLLVAYEAGSWWFVDGHKWLRCRSIYRALRVFWRRVSAIMG